jgi:hypothetical protein
MKQQVVRVFVEVAGEAGCRGRHVVTKTPFVGGETTFYSKPAENFALQGGSTPLCTNDSLHA